MVPFLHNHVEMIKHDLADFSPQPWGHGVCPRLLNIQEFGVQPKFALRVALLRVNVNRLVTLVGVKENSPSTEKQDCRLKRFHIILRSKTMIATRLAEVNFIWGRKGDREKR